MPIERAVYLGVAIATHGLLGYALVSALLEADPRIGAVLGVAPDVDLLFPASWGPPLAHRSLTHAPSVVIAVVVFAYGARRRPGDAALVGLPVGSHLIVDALSPMGLPLVIPLAVPSAPPLPVHGAPATVILWGVAGLLLWGGGRTADGGTGRRTPRPRGDAPPERSTDD